MKTNSARAVTCGLVAVVSIMAGGETGPMSLAQAQTTAPEATPVPEAMPAPSSTAGAPAVSADEVAALRAQIAALQTRLDKIETDAQVAKEANEKAAAEKAATVKAGGIDVSSKEKLVISGLLQVQGLGYFGQDATFPRKADTIRLRRSELRISAPSITPRISGQVMFDPAKAINGSTNIAAGQNINIRARDNVMQELQLSYLLSKGKKGNHYIDIGQFKIPVGYEGDLVSSAGLQTIERALFYTQRDPSGSDSGYGDIRDSGVQLRGTLGDFDYRAAIFNGLGDRQNALATTDPKAVVGRIVYHPHQVAGLQLGVSGANGNDALDAAGRRFSRNLFNLFGVYKKDKLTFQAEYLVGHSQLRGGPAFSDIRGYYGSLGYLFSPKVEGVVRYDTLDTNHRVNNATVHDITLGVNYYIKGTNAKIQANIVRHEGAAGSPIADLKPDRTELRTNFQVAF